MKSDKNNINSKPPKEMLEIIGNLFESSRIANDLEKLINSIDIARSIKTDELDIHNRAILFYFMGNAWSYVQKIKYPNEEFPLETEELENQIRCLRKAYELIKMCENDFIKCQILTNLGSIFSHIGRFSEAQEYYNLCLKTDKHFGMAIGNRGFSLYYYARVVFDPNQQFIFMQYARKDLLNSLSAPDVYPDAKKAFYTTIQQIEKAFTKDQLDDFVEYNDFYKNLSDKEKEYREWCALNKLFINPLNDLITISVVSNDYFFTPSMILKFDEKPIYHSIFNQLKQEYVSARYLFFESLNQDKAHFSDKDVVLMDTLDYSVYSYALEKTKITFRICYSIFDKIAYFINSYLKLDHDPNRVNFRNVWYNKLNKKCELNNKLLVTKNWAMRGLFWLSKDIYEKGFNTSIEPEAKGIATIRNFIEHKSFKIVESFNHEWFEITETCEIDRSLFYEKTLKILKLSRSALMYLSFLIYDEENQRRKEMGDKLFLPMEFIKLVDEEKI
jgi:tetratricopeptide (TPR) repeat protein